MKRVIFLITLFTTIVVQGFSQELEYIDGHFYKKGMLYTGEHIEYFENGNPKFMRNIKNGLLHKQMLVFDEDSIKLEQHSYKEGVKDGTWINWDKNGVKIAVANYKDGKKNGEWFIWDSQANLLYDMHYKNGKKSGVWKKYDSSGTLISKRRYK